jgi:ABC-type amino acid transport substrate-binding protein
MARFNAALAEIRADGTYDEIVARHLGKAEDGGV